MNNTAPEANTSALAPFSVRSFRFQWPADLLTSWAFEMETLILGWYVLVETDSVLLLTAFGSLQFLGTLIAPMVGVAADRLGRRVVLCAMRASYGALALAIMVLALSDKLNAYWVLAIALLAGLVRPSDLVVRNSLIGDTVPGSWLARAIGLSRTTMDSARIAGALAGAGLFATLGIGPAYMGVVALYALSFALTFGVAGRSTGYASDAASPWQELKAGLRYIRHTPQVLALMLLAFLVNLTAYPISMGLLPYVAKEIYALDQNGLGHLVAGYACGALLGSVIMILAGGARRPGRLMVIGTLVWYLTLVVFALQETKWPGFVVLLTIGVVQSMAMIAMSVTLLQITPEKFRGRIMGVRMLAVYGLPLGLLAAGGLVGWIGFAPTVWAYAVFGIVCTAYIAWRWRTVIWR
ncbi:MAG: MFS transporter [Rhodospirillaceae bacterium]|nr:MFS transporter [Rhodospirillaceae bacterium]MBT4688833.1 MFS transporter [Rhodospirillaceae bacterium]MBT5194121.1 MFS transporter [Rhodospirillaceae bacterium]MBT5898605.1 MFS transporter [Rhodospirillaceae bacterium]MBT7760559.1 MFS transporter [Rhodospirillaceae bacterium]